LSPLSAPNRATAATISPQKSAPETIGESGVFRFEVELSLRVMGPFADIVRNGARPRRVSSGAAGPDCRQPGFTPQLTRLQKPLFFGLKALFVTRRHGINQIVEQSFRN
jgi:hypothetical protein